jgi:hypothetical protein
MKVENHTERKIEIGGWQVNLRTYQIGETFHCKADNVSPGANIARSTGATREATERLAATKRRAV